MSKKDAYVFTSDDAENYDRYLGPVLFEPYGKYLASQLGAVNAQRILELASGSGRVTAHLREALPADTELWATDLSADMLGIAQRKLGTEGIKYATEDIQNLSFPDNSFDVVICQFGMMFLPDKQKGFNEIYRVLKPGGKLLCFTWNSTAHNPLFGLLINELMLPHFPGEDTARFFVPFSLHNPDQLAAWLENAGFKTINTETVGLASGPTSLEDAVTGFYRLHALGKAMRDKGDEVYNAVREKFRNEVAKRYGEQISFPMSALLTVAVK
jgi:ubiquinone/menaquinone biosynthesis C-methylase UbiE